MREFEKKETISILELKEALEPKLSSFEQDPEIVKWKQGLKKAREDLTYREGVYIACLLSNKTPSQIIQEAIEDIKTHGKLVRANRLGLKLDLFLQKLRQRNGEQYAPTSLGLRMCGYMSFINCRTDHQLGKKVQAHAE